MTALKNLLAATDFSSPSRQAADRAARLAKTAGARLRLVHALSGGALARLQQWMGWDSAIEQAFMEQTRRALEEMAGELSAARGVAVESALVHGAVLEEITRQVEEMDADLVVLGALGTDFMRRFMLGSTAERLLRKSKAPMLVVKQRAHEPYRRVLVAVDCSEWSAPLLDLARSVAPGAHLVLLNAYDVPFEGKLRFASVPDATIEKFRVQSRQAATDQLHALAAGAGLKPTDWTPCIAYADASLAIVEQEQELDCDLIVIGKHGQNMAEELLLGSVTKHVLVESAGDVLVSTARRP
jgi:nucleotide-binding universal stress UspA family protein